MDIEWFRDLVICISGLVATGVVIFAAVLLYLFYRRLRPILDSVEAASDKAGSILDSIEGTTATIKGISSYVADEVVKPTVQVVALIQGIRSGIDVISRFFKKQEQEGERDG